jgi:hypothetical protein
MRRTSRISLLFIAALVVSAFSAQSAFALWTQEGAPLEESAEISLDGTWKAEIPIAGFGWQCDDVTGDTTLDGESEPTLGSITDMSFAACKGLGSLSTTYVEVLTTKLPWAVEGKAGAIRFTPNTFGLLEIVHRSGGKTGPIVKTVYCELFSLALTPNNQHAIASLQGTGNLSCGGLPISSQFKFDVSPAGLYGWE